jgi:hypothetical protein
MVKVVDDVPAASSPRIDHNANLDLKAIFIIAEVLAIENRVHEIAR